MTLGLGCAEDLKAARKLPGADARNPRQPRTTPEHVENVSGGRAGQSINNRGQ